MREKRRECEILRAVKETGKMAQHVTLECGTYKTQCTTSENDFCIRQFPTVVGITRIMLNMFSTPLKKHYIGDEAFSKRGILVLKYPIEYGRITNWDHIEQIWHHAFENELRVDKTEQSVLLAESTASTPIDREKTVQLMFENVQVKKLAIENSQKLSLLGTGRTTGVVVDAGHQGTSVVPIYDAKNLYEESSKQMIYETCQVGGTDIEEYFSLLLTNIGHYFGTVGGRYLLKELKVTAGYVLPDPSAAPESQRTKNGTVNNEYEMPDGSRISCYKTAHECTEPFFDLKKIGRAQRIESVQAALWSSLEKVAEHINVGAESQLGQGAESTPAMLRSLAANVILAGGCAKFPGFRQRLTYETLQLYRAKKQQLGKRSIREECAYFEALNVISSRNCDLLASKGGGLLCSLSSYRSSANTWITAEEYEESGPSIVHRKHPR